MVMNPPSRTSEPSWILKDPSSFASIHIKLPPGTAVNCESDAVVTFSQTVRVRGTMSGGILSSLARWFLTKESFFMTVVENADHECVADVMMAAKDTGGIVLHRITPGHNLILTSGAYIASDADVKVTSKLQTQLGNSLLSGTGFFLLEASGRGYVACGAYGASHRYILKEGERRAVDNGHLIAWSSQMKYTVGLASGTGRIVNSMTSGEGLMCFFEGPGVVFLQSHKPEAFETGARKTPTAKPVYPCCSIIASVLTLLITVSLAIWPFIVIWLSDDDVQNPIEQEEQRWWRREF
eukprot:scaffold4481_cov121-Cylindrotheca_fusiformis.AAC.2